MTILIQTIEALPLAHNKARGAHWGTLAKEKKDWQMMVKQCHSPQTEGTKRRVEIVFRKSRGPLNSDRDNLFARCKPVLDALVSRGWIQDDAPRFIDLDVREERGPRATIIAVSEINEGLEAA